MKNTHDVYLRDDKGNKCSIAYFGSKKKAKKALESLNGCRNCTNCYDCYDCFNCVECRYCDGVVSEINKMYVVNYG